MMSRSREEILFIQTGGTIDKDYPKTIGGYNFEIDEAAVKRITAKIKPSVGFKYIITSVCRKDSQEINQGDREAILKCILEADQLKIIVTHGTDTLIETARFIQQSLQSDSKSVGKIVMFVGAFFPERFKDSDADMNIGSALGALDILHMKQVATNDVRRNDDTCVYIALGGRVIPAIVAARDSNTGLFCRSDELAGGN